MIGRFIGLVAAISLSLLAVGCGGTCDELCDFAADYYQECLPQWNTTWEGLAPEGDAWTSKSDFKQSCQDSAQAGQDQAGDCCLDLEDEDKTAECEANTLLAIDRNCEDTKELYRQPCSEYWQEVYLLGGPMFPDDNPTCSEDETEE